MRTIRTTVVVAGALIVIAAYVLSNVYLNCDGRCAFKRALWSKHCQDMCFQNEYCPATGKP